MEKTNAPHNDEVAASDKTEEAQYHLETTQTPNNADHVAIEAMGGESAEAMPKHYYRSPAFIGTFLVSSVLFGCAKHCLDMMMLIWPTVNGLRLSRRFFVLCDGGWSNGHHQRRHWYVNPNRCPRDES